MVPDTPTSSAARAVATRALQYSLAGAVLLAPHADEAASLRLYGLLILALPWLLARAGGVEVTTWQRGWLALALALHPLGALYDVYRHVWWYDHVTHLAAATLVAGLGYLVVRTVFPADVHPRIAIGAHLLVLGGVLAGGVAWELYELQVAYLTVYGPLDTAGDLAFDVAGWLVAVPAERRLVGRLDVGLRDRFVSTATLARDCGRWW